MQPTVWDCVTDYTTLYLLSYNPRLSNEHPDTPRALLGVNNCPPLGGKWVGCGVMTVQGAGISGTLSGDLPTTAVQLAHRHLNKMAAISQTTFSNAFSSRTIPLKHVLWDLIENCSVIRWIAILNCGNMTVGNICNFRGAESTGEISSAILISWQKSYKFYLFCSQYLWSSMSLDNGWQIKRGCSK